MRPSEFRKIRREQLGLTQEQLAAQLGTTRMTITRYEAGTRRISGLAQMAVKQLAESNRIPMVGIVAAGVPIEPILQTELVDVPPSMARSGENFALRIKGESMREEGILPGDIVVVHKQATARNGQTVVALVNQEGTIKKYFRKAGRIELHPANAEMKPIIVTPEDDFQIQGIVIGLIRHCE
jgi:repressor LexA